MGLLPLDEVRRRLRITGQSYAGVQEVPLDRIVRACDLPRSTAYHLLNTMIDEGFVVLPYTTDDPILAKKLEEAGCADDEILNHGRRLGAHVRGSGIGAVRQGFDGIEQFLQRMAGVRLDGCHRRHPAWSEPGAGGIGIRRQG